MSDLTLMAWGAVYFLARLTWLIALFVDVASRWGEVLVLVGTTATLVWMVALIVAWIASVVLRVQKAKGRIG